MKQQCHLPIGRQTAITLLFSVQSGRLQCRRPNEAKTDSWEQEGWTGLLVLLADQLPFRLESTKLWFSKHTPKPQLMPFMVLLKICRYRLKAGLSEDNLVIRHFSTVMYSVFETKQLRSVLRLVLRQNFLQINMLDQDLQNSEPYLACLF